MALTINAKNYRNDASEPNSQLYCGPAHTLSSKDTAKLKRVLPIKGGGTDGVARPGVVLNRTSTINATTGQKADNSLRLEGSFAVGTPEADIDAMCADLAAWIVTADAKKLFKQLQVAF